MPANARNTSVSNQPCDPYVFDTTHFQKLLSDNSKRALVPDDELQIKLIEVGATGTKRETSLRISLTKVDIDTRFSNIGAFDKYLEETQFQGTRIM
jgi:hypothetical protein